jgi:putative hemolysin
VASNTACCESNVQKGEARSLAASRPLRLVLESIIALFLIGLNGLFSLSELAVVSARKVRLKALAEAGRSGARAALDLAEDPGRFLSTVQIGITLVGILAGAFSGAALGARLTDLFVNWGLAIWLAEPIGYGLVIGLITYLSVVIGELVPKHLALKNAEGIACAVAPLMARVSRIGAPVVWVLDASTELVFRLLGKSTETRSAVTEEEVRTIVAEAETAGAIACAARSQASRSSDSAAALATPFSAPSRSIGASQWA